MLEEAGVESVSTWVGAGVPRFYLPLNQIFPQSNVSQAIVLPKSLKEREALRARLPRILAERVPRGARPRQAAAERAAGGVSGAVPRRRPRHRRRSPMGRPRQGADARESEPARRERQLERVRQGAAPAGRSGQGARSGRQQPADRAGLAHAAVGHADRPVPRGRPADRHRAAPAGRRAQRDHRPGQRLRAHGERAFGTAVAGGEGQVRLGAGRAVARRTATTRSPCRAT